MNCCLVKAGDLNRKVAFNMLEETPDGQGGFVSEFVPFKTMWCAIKPSKGKEAVDRGRLNNTQSYDVTCRYFAGLNETMQGVYKGKEFQIRSIVNVDEGNEWYQLVLERTAKAQ